LEYGHGGVVDIGKEIRATGDFALKADERIEVSEVRITD
jgi:hypothetical protein